MKPLFDHVQTLYDEMKPFSIATYTEMNRCDLARFLISRGCPQPSIALQVQNRGLKHQSQLDLYSIKSNCYRTISNYLISNHNQSNQIRSLFDTIKPLNGQTKTDHYSILSNH